MRILAERGVMLMGRGVVGGGCEAVAEVVVEDARGVVFITVDDHDGTGTASVPLPLECGYDNALGRGEGAAEEFLELATVYVGRADCALAVGCDEAAEHGLFVCKDTPRDVGMGCDNGISSDESDRSDGSDRDEGLVKLG